MPTRQSGSTRRRWTGAVGVVAAVVTVLALSADSEAGEHGLAPGDVIESVGGKPVAALRDFMPTYFSVTQRARTNGQPYAFQVWRPGESRQVTVSVGAPPSLMHML